MNAETQRDAEGAQRLGTWITTALMAGQGRKLIVVQDARWGWMAILDFSDIGERIGDRGDTPGAALAALETKLMKDAGDEMVKAGAV